jgi:hypothetical protein
MRNLIRKILKEEVGNIETFTIEEIDISDFFEDLLNEGYTTISIPNWLSDEVKITVTDLMPHTHKSKGNMYWCPEYDEKGKKNKNDNNFCRFNFKITTTPHWVKRILRTDEPNYSEGGADYNPRIENPEVYECLKVIEQNIKEIMATITKRRDWAKNTELDFKLSVIRDGKILEQIITIYKIDSNHYEIILKTNIKGVKLIDNKPPKPINIKNLI